MQISKKSALIILAANNFSEAEFLTVKRGMEAAGYRNVTASDTVGVCIGDAGLRIKPDMPIFNIHSKNFAMLIFIGGKGIVDYAGNKKLQKTAREFMEEGKPVGAICAAPVILAKSGILKNRKGTGHISVQKELVRGGALWNDSPVVADDKLITASGPESAGEFVSALLRAR